MVLAEKGKDDIELISYDVLRDNEAICEKYFNWLEDLRVTNLISSLDLLLPKKKDFIEQSFNRFTQQTAIGFFIRFIPDDAIIGTTKLDQISFYKRLLWDGIMIGEKEYQGKGLARQVYRILLAYAFQILGMHKVCGGCNEKNIAMIKIFEKLGYQKEGVLRKNDYINGNYSDHLLFGILKEEFFKNNSVELNI